mgnify:CR=1 FL=1
MPPERRGSPLGDILLLGTCVSLILPIGPALADPAALPDWGVASKAKPEPTPPASTPPAAAPASPAPTEAAEPAAPAEADIEIEDDPDPAAPSPRSSRPAKSKPKSKAKSKSGRKASRATNPPAQAELLAQQARAEALRQEARNAARRRGHGELITGALLTTGGLAGFGVMAGGLFLNRLSDRELDKGAGRPEQDLAPLYDQKRQAETMIAAGAVAGAAGLALGVALLVIGARDLKAARGAPLAARVRIAPTLGGFVLAGRF